MITLQAPAKLNLCLSVLGRRSDGYHNLCTVFQRINLWDELHIVRTNSCSTPFLSVSGRCVPSGPRNLVYQAYQLLRKECPTLPALKVRLQKCIPVAAGLGGGSSDAGIFLSGVNRIFRLGLPYGKIQCLAEELGADVPFFASQMSSAVGFGRGDELRPLKSWRRLWFVVACFSKGLPTKEIYKRYTLSKHAPSVLTKAKCNVNILCNYLVQKDLSQVRKCLKNDLRSSCEDLKPAVRRVLNFMEANGARAASITGSGPTCFAIMQNASSAERLAGFVRRKFRLDVYVCHSY